MQQRSEKRVIATEDEIAELAELGFLSCRHTENGGTDDNLDCFSNEHETGKHFRIMKLSDTSWFINEILYLDSLRFPRRLASNMTFPQLLKVISDLHG